MNGPIVINPLEVVMLSEVSGVNYSYSANAVIKDRIIGCVNHAFANPQEFDGWIQGAIFWLRLFNSEHGIMDQLINIESKDK